MPSAIATPLEQGRTARPSPDVPGTAEGSGAPVDPFTRTQTRLEGIQRAAGTAAALAELDRLTQAEPEINRTCHAIAHDLGHRALDMVDGDAARALADRDDVCGGGYTHGVIEHALGEAAHPRTAMLTLCAPAQDGSCWHGIGHGLMFATGMDAQAATALCDRAPTRALAARCGEGVFMQLFSADLSAHHTGGDPTIAEDPQRAAAQCQRTRGAYAGNCWFYAPVVWLTRHPEAFAEGIHWCADAGRHGAAQACAKGIGSRAVKYHPDDLAIGARACAQAGEYRDPCLQGMASYWSVHWKGAVPPRDLCQHLERRTLRERCRAVT